MTSPQTLGQVTYWWALVCASRKDRMIQEATMIIISEAGSYHSLEMVNLVGKPSSTS
jgi:hypothetical protein